MTIEANLAQAQPTATRRFRWSVVGTGFIYVYLITTLLLLVLKTATSHLWPVILWASFLPLGLLVGLLAAPILVLKRQWIGMLLVVPIAYTFATQYGRFFVPGQTHNATVDDEPTLVLMTLNLGDDLAKAKSEQVVHTIHEADADILAFQEVTAEHAQAFQTDLISDYPYQVIYAAGQGTLGVALLSRYPVISASAFYGEIDLQPYMDVTLDADDIEITIINVHPAPPELTRDPRHLIRTRGLADTRLFAEKATSGKPTVLLGDFNATDQSPEYALLASFSLQDAFYENGSGFGFTYPANRPYGYTNLPSIPLFRIDYIWHTDHFTTLDAWLGSDVGSDHLPVLAELALMPD